MAGSILHITDENGALLDPEDWNLDNEGDYRECIEDLFDRLVEAGGNTKPKS